LSHKVAELGGIVVQMEEEEEVEEEVGDSMEL
jgi:hypothetical protein